MLLSPVIEFVNKTQPRTRKDPMSMGPLIFYSHEALTMKLDLQSHQMLEIEDFHCNVATFVEFPDVRINVYPSSHGYTLGKFGKHSRRQSCPWLMI